MSWLALGYYCWLGRPPTLRGEKQSEQWNNSPEEISNPVKNWRNILNKISCNLSVDFVFLSGLTYFIISNQQSYLFPWIVYSNTLLTKIYQSLIWWMLITRTMSPSSECGRECLIEQQITMIQLPCDGCKMTCALQSWWWWWSPPSVSSETRLTRVTPQCPSSPQRTCTSWHTCYYSHTHRKYKGLHFIFDKIVDI